MGSGAPSTTSSFFTEQYRGHAARPVAGSELREASRDVTGDDNDAVIVAGSGHVAATRYLMNVQERRRQVRATVRGKVAWRPHGDMAIVLLLVIVALCAWYYYCTKDFDYWKKRGVVHEKPVLLFGNAKDVFLLKKSISQVMADLYHKFPNEKVVGYYRGSRPQLLIKDPEIIKRVLIKDFEPLHRRGFNIHKTEIEILRHDLFFADGDLWRMLRTRMTPAFTSGKLRAMFPLVAARAARLQERLTAAAVGATLDARDLMARYTTDFIGAVGFGLDADSINDPNSPFRKLGKKLFTFTLRDTIVVFLKEFFPETFKKLKYFERTENDFLTLVSEVMKQRNYEPIGRNDFIDQLLEAKKKGTIICDSIEKPRNADGTPQQVTLEFYDELIAAQVFIFFAAGFETSSSATSYTLHELAYNPEIQKKVQNEIDVVLAKYNNELCYDAIREMTYLTWTFKEGMRIFPSLGYISRECAKSYVLPETETALDEGVRLIISLQGLHMDPTYFPDPEEFRPERFSPENFTDEHKFVYLPFGEGPRGCIGERLGLMQSLAGLAAVLSVSSVAPAQTTQRHPRRNPRSNIVQTVIGGMPLLFIPRNNT